MFEDGAVHGKGRVVGLTRISGVGEWFRELRDQVGRLAALDSTVLVTGETGTGKGQVARALHEESARRNHPFIHVDCAALSPTLIESELFGHEKGSFTSAAERRVGRFELVGTGTIFLDEVGDVDAGLQAKLLRVLEDREFERVGGTSTLRMRGRVVAATSRDLRRGVQEGRFRVDLYYRLNVFRLELRPLRERFEDLPALVSEGLERAARRLGLGKPEPSGDFIERLTSHGWPGNVRELNNVLERVVACAPAGAADARSLDGLIEQGVTPVVERANGKARSLVDLVEEIGAVERHEILEALAWSGGNVTAAARRLRIPRSTLRGRIGKHGIEQRIVEVTSGGRRALGGKT